jgi:hypothetical protein
MQALIYDRFHGKKKPGMSRAFYKASKWANYGVP